MGLLTGIACLHLLDHIRCRLEKELRVSFSKLDREMIPPTEEDEDEPEKQEQNLNNAMMILTNSSQRGYKRIRNTLQLCPHASSILPSYHAMSKIRPDVTAFIIDARAHKDSHVPDLIEVDVDASTFDIVGGEKTVSL